VTCGRTSTQDGDSVSVMTGVTVELQLSQGKVLTGIGLRENVSLLEVIGTSVWLMEWVRKCLSPTTW